MNRLLGAIAVAAALLSTTAEAATIFGKFDCGQWVNRQRERAHAETWLLGYLSGLNGFHTILDRTPKDPLGALNSADQAFVWVDNYCQANPLKQLDEAAVELFLELKFKKR